MARNKTIDADDFAITLEEIIDEVGDCVQDGLYDGILNADGIAYEPICRKYDVRFATGRFYVIVFLAVAGEVFFG